MDFLEAFTAITIVFIVFSFVLIVIKMGLSYSERIERMKHGYPLTGDMKGKDDYVDYRNR